MDRSFKLCTAKSTSSRNNASSISLVNNPLPPISAKTRSRNLSPEVTIRFKTTFVSGESFLIWLLTHLDWVRARALALVPITMDLFFSFVI